MLYSAARFVIMRPASGDNGAIKNLVGFPSGQREQTVNLPSQTSKVRILPPPPSFLIAIQSHTNTEIAYSPRGRSRTFDKVRVERSETTSLATARRAKSVAMSHPSPTTILSYNNTIPYEHRNRIIPTGKVENLR